MQHSNTATYDTNINIIGGLKDLSGLFKAVDSYFDENDSVSSLVSERNEFSLRTIRSRSRIVSAINKMVLSFSSPKHEELFRSFFSSKAALPERDLVMFWQLAMNNRLFREISTQVFAKIYTSGRIGLSKDDIIAWLKEVVVKNPQNNLKWTENTISTLATKYLNIMTRLNLLEGARKKSFRHIRLSTEAQVIFLYFAMLYKPFETNILNNDFLPLSFIAEEDLHERLKKLSLKGFVSMSYTGKALNLELVHDCKGICHALYR
jgi:hypothetical protein